VEVSAALMVGLGLVAGLAGFVDAIAGGGGLLTLPALLMAGLPADLALGTNKGQSVFGSGAALWRFARSPLLNRPRARQSALPAFGGAALGVLLVRHVPNDLLRPVVLVLLGAVALVLLFRRGPPAGGPPRQRHVGLVVAVAAGLGFYDGFFGPGTGTFLIMAYVTLWHDRMDEASANAKVANFMSNLASMAAFATVGAVVWQLALPMAVGQAVGGRLGAQVTVTRGSPLVRMVVIGVSLALVARLTWQVVTG
jgi:uncharacterized membrane protein YfcA